MTLTADRREALARRAIALLDLTNLDDACTADDVRELWHAATTPFGPVAAVCIWPQFVSIARGQRRNDPEDPLAGAIAIAAVANFPGGDEPVGDVERIVRSTVQMGADEIDLVMPYRPLIAGDEAPARAMIRTVRAACDDETVLKVIIETGELKEADLIAWASRIAIDGGADFIKTSTGKTPVSATPQAARVILETIRDAGRPVGLKASGGIRTVDQAATYLDLADEIMGQGWATASRFRFGASSLLGNLLATTGSGMSSPRSGP